MEGSYLDHLQRYGKLDCHFLFIYLYYLYLSIVSNCQKSLWVWCFVCIRIYTVYACWFSFFKSAFWFLKLFVFFLNLELFSIMIFFRISILEEYQCSHLFVVSRNAISHVLVLVFHNLVYYAHCIFVFWCMVVYVTKYATYVLLSML